MSENLRATIDFLRDLRVHNDRAWFEQNRQSWEVARGHFETFVAELIVAFSAFEDLGSVTSADCMYRIYRDVRFSPFPR